MCKIETEDTLKFETEKLEFLIKNNAPKGLIQRQTDKVNKLKEQLQNF